MGIEKLCNAIRPSVSAVNEFIGPAQIRSDAALLKAVARKPSMVSIVGEFGVTMKLMCDLNAPHYLEGLQQALLDLYSKSGRGNTMRGMVYSDPSKNVGDIIEPAFSLLAESTPSTFYAALDETLIQQGLLPRFTIIEYVGDRPDYNQDAHSVEPSEELRKRFADLVVSCIQHNHQGGPLAVIFDEEATALSSSFNALCDRKIRNDDRGVVRDLWNRAHLKAMKLASLVAVGVNSYAPMITGDIWLWAQNLIMRDVDNIVERFDEGEVGRPDTHDKQENRVIDAINHYMRSEFPRIAGYCRRVGNAEQMHQDGIIPLSYVKTKIGKAAAFVHDRAGSSVAIERALKSLIDDGVLLEVSPMQMRQFYSQPNARHVTRAFYVNDRAIFDHRAKKARKK